MKSLNCVIIEDNRLDRLLLEENIARHPFMTIVASFHNPVESLEFIQHNNFDLLFIDVDMPVMNGIDFIRSLQTTPPCIFVTQHPEFAVDAFDIQAIDYLVKPVRTDRFDRAVQRTLELIRIKEKAVQYSFRFENDSLMVREGSSVTRVSIPDILYLEALTNYTRIVTPAKTHITLSNLKNFLDDLPKEKFLRIHRSYAVAIDRIDALAGNDVIVAGKKLPLGRTYRHEVKQFIKAPH